MGQRVSLYLIDSKNISLSIILSFKIHNHTLVKSVSWGLLWKVLHSAIQNPAKHYKKANFNAYWKTRNISWWDVRSTRLSTSTKGPIKRSQHLLWQTATTTFLVTMLRQSLNEFKLVTTCHNTSQHCWEEWSNGLNIGSQQILWQMLWPFDQGLTLILLKKEKVHSGLLLVFVISMFTRHYSISVLILLGNHRLSLSIMTEWADMRVEGAGTSQLLLPTLRHSVNPPKELGINSFPWAGISHLSHLLHELANALAVLEWAAFLESRAHVSKAVVLGSKISVWAHAFAKSGALGHCIIQGDAHGGLEEKNIQVL